ncbi:MAG: hypothetical protein STSR0004_19990 [Peptococcaceae bacterium]
MFWQIKGKRGIFYPLVIFLSLLILAGFMGLKEKEVLAAQNTVKMGDFEGKPGSVVTVPVIIENANGMAGAQFDLSYDPKVAVAKAVEKGDLVKDFILTTNLEGAANGLVRTALAGAQGVTGNGTLVVVKFQLQDKGVTTVEIKNVELNDEKGNPLVPSILPGKISIKSAGQITPPKDEEVKKEPEKVKEPEKKPEKVEPEKKEEPKKEADEFFLDKAIDVPIVYWAREYIEKLLQQDIISGYPDKTFRPNNSISRAEFTKLLVKALKLESSEKAASTFIDVYSQDWFFSYVQAAADANLVKGAEGKFLPHAFITRQEMAVILIRALDKEEKALEKAKETLSFQDAGEIAPWAKGQVALAVEEGLLKGYPDNTFAPGKKASRAEACAIVYHLMEAKKCKP